MKNRMVEFVTNEDGLTTVEYAMAGGLVGATIIGGFQLLGGQVGRVITAVMNAVATVSIA